MEYSNNYTEVIIICPVHGNFKQIPSNHLQGHGCGKCGNSIKYNKEEFINICLKIHGNIYNYDKVKYLGNKEKVIITCDKHGDFKQTPHNHLHKQGCPKCKRSKGEIKVENYLIENNINFKPQYSFPDLKNKRRLLFDFGVLDENNNLKYLLEFNGEQHYKFDNHFHKTEEDFKKSKLRDNLKLDYCSKNNIPLFIIKYNEDIKEKMLICQ